MKKLLFIFPIAVLLLSGCGKAAKSNPPTNGKPNNASQSANSMKFSDQPYYKDAYLISSDNLSDDAKKALAGFKMEKKTLPDGTTQINLKAQESQYHDQSYTLKNGEQLYFIDKFLGDDQGSSESNIGEDQAVIVDSQGNVVQPPSGF